MAKSLSQQLLNTLELRRGSVINTDEVRALKRRWDTMLRLRADPTLEMYTLQEHGPYQVSAEIDAIGRKWWAQALYTPAGNARHTAFIRGMSIPIIGAVYSGIERFELLGFTVDWGGARDWAFPVYRLFGKNGYAVEFTQRGWQSGGNTVD